MTTTDEADVDRRDPQSSPVAMSAARRSERIRKPRGAAHVLILAGGDGARLRSVTRVLAGDDRPKQFCSLVGSEPLLVQTQRRAALIAPPERTLILLTRHHEAYYRSLVSAINPASLVIQPANRGTAAAVLYGLLRIAVRTPRTAVVIMPSDHWVSDESAFATHVRSAVGVVEAYENVVVLLGTVPTRPEPEYGWIEPAEPVVRGWRDLHRVSRFVEKPEPPLAAELYRDGTAFWNTSVVVGQVEELLYLFAVANPDLVDAFLGIWTALDTPAERGAAELLYAGLPSSDFSRDILAARPEALAVLAIHGVLWEDLGHPSRIREARRLQQALPPPRGMPAAG